MDETCLLVYNYVKPTVLFETIVTKSSLGGNFLLPGGATFTFMLVSVEKLWKTHFDLGIH